jgi:recombinational DNA repair protein (RecF pathway)
MASVVCLGIVLKRKNFGEADRMMTVLTDRFGKIPVVARGVRRITSRRAGNVELLNLVKLHLFKGKGYTLTEAEAVETFPKIKENLTLSSTAFHIIELVDRLTVEEESNPKLFELTLAAIKILEKNPRQIFIRAFEVKLLHFLGFLSADRLSGIDESLLLLLQNLEEDSWADIAKLNISGGEAEALEQFMRMNIERILESKLKSSDVYRKMK